jgi:hypothetical protein
MFNGLVRPGISLGREDFCPRHLPSWRRSELRHGLHEAAQESGEPMTRKTAASEIAHACNGAIDPNGDLAFTCKWNSKKSSTA